MATPDYCLLKQAQRCVCSTRQVLGKFPARDAAAWRAGGGNRMSARDWLAPLMRILNFRPAPPIKPIEDPALIGKLFKRYRTMIMIAMTVGYGFYYTCRLGLSVVKKPLIDAGILTPEQLGQIGGAMLYGYAFGKFFNGFLADHVNVRKFFATGLMLSALCNLCFGLSSVFWVFVAVWAINGYVQGIGAGSCVVSLGNWFTYRERGRYWGVWSSSHSIGEGLTFVVSSALVTYFGWRWGFLGPAVICVAVAYGAYWMFRDRPASCGLPHIADWRNEHGQAAEPAGQTTWAAQVAVFKMPAIWIICLCASLTYITRYAVSSWGMLYLQESRGMSALEAGGLLGLNTAVGVVGGILYGFLSDIVFKGRRPPATLIYCILEIAALVVIYVMPTTNHLLLAAAFAVFGFAMGGLLLGACGVLAVDLAPKKASGAAIGVIGICSYVASAIQDQVSGRLIESHMTTVNGVKHYDFSHAVIFWVGSSVLAALFGMLVWNAKAKE